jgi:hypothetical protein
MKNLFLTLLLLIVFITPSLSQDWITYENKEFGIKAQFPGAIRDTVTPTGSNTNLQVVHNDVDLVLFSLTIYQEPVREGIEADVIVGALQEGDRVVGTGKTWEHGGKSWLSAVIYSSNMGGYLHRRVMIDGKRLFNMTYISESESSDGNVDRFYKSISF